MKKVKLYVSRDMTVIGTKNKDLNRNFGGFFHEGVVANVVSIHSYESVLGYKCYDVQTDFVNPYRKVASKFTLTEENFLSVEWVD